MQTPSRKVITECARGRHEAGIFACELGNLHVVQIELPECTIRSWQWEDAPSLAASANNRNVWLTLRDRMPHPYALADAHNYLRARLAEPTQPVFCIDRAGEAIGGIGLHLGSDVMRLTAELGYWLAEPFWGCGIMTAAVRAVVRYGFESQPIERVEAYVFSNNPASVRVVEKAQFSFEGRLRRSVIKDGQILDSLLFARLRGDPVAETPGGGSL